VVRKVDYKVVGDDLHAENDNKRGKLPTGVGQHLPEVSIGFKIGRKKGSYVQWQLTKSMIRSG
jgi:hypothetical protein